MRALLVLPLLFGCRGVEPATVPIGEAPPTPPAPTAAEDAAPRREPDGEPRIVVRRAWTPERGDAQGARRKLVRCCADLERLAEATTGEERPGLMGSALECNAARDDPKSDPREALGKLRVGMEGGPMPPSCR